MYVTFVLCLIQTLCVCDLCVVFVSDTVCVTCVLCLIEALCV